MNKTKKYLYNIIFWISRFFTILVFGMSLFTVFHTKYVFPETYSIVITSFVINLKCFIDSFVFFFLFRFNDNMLLLYLIILQLIAVLIMLTTKKYISMILFIIYTTIYIIFRLPILLVLAIITPITLIIIRFLNKLYFVQKIIILIPTVLRNFFADNKTNNVLKNSSESLKNIYLTILSILISNILCFLIPYKIYDSLEQINNFNIGDAIYIFYINAFITMCKNSQNIYLLLIIPVLILIISILIIKKYNKRYKYLLLIVISSFVYIIVYLIFRAPIMLALAIVVPITFVLIQILNKICPIQKVVMLIPIIGDIFCTRNVVKYIYKNCSENLKNISLLITALIISNIVCFLISLKTSKDFENRIMDDWTYSIRTYQDEMIISGEGELIIIDTDGNDIHIYNRFFEWLEDFIVNINQNKLYLYRNAENINDKSMFLMLDIETLKIVYKNTFSKKCTYVSRLCCNDDFSKLIFVEEGDGIVGLIDLNTYTIKYTKVAKQRDGLIYNKYRDCFLISFHDENSFLQEIDIDNKKIRNIKADKYQGYLAISNKNKEIYVAFHQQGQIGVYDAQTMKLKRKIKSNYTVKDITYDEELNILIAPSYFTGYVDIFLMDGSDKLLTREFVGYKLREACFDPQKENLYVCSAEGLYKKKIDIKKLIEENSKKQ